MFKVWTYAIYSPTTLTAEGSWIYLWTGSGQVIPFHIKCGLILLLHGDVVHSGGNSCSVDHMGTSYPRLYFYLLGSPRDHPGDFVSYINFDGEEFEKDYYFEKE
jgi:hypothetical protein